MIFFIRDKKRKKEKKSEKCCMHKYLLLSWGQGDQVRGPTENV